ncbi:hypothetical protein LTR53_011755 [Teratosphaeriaceae sp. CCFEE 6253]|nr:hypothetical protein LTR53_011755 [Teratosphaeriaceae sp. CCFEE 6253]
MLTVMLAIAALAIGGLAARVEINSASGAIDVGRESQAPVHVVLAASIGGPADFESSPGGVTGSGVITTTYDEISQTVITTTFPASPTTAQPSCDAHGSCVFPPSCAASFPGYISCSGDGTSTPSSDAMLSPITSGATTPRATTSNATSSAVLTTPMATLTLTAEGARLRVPLQVVTSIMSGLALADVPDHVDLKQAKRQVDISKLLSAIISVAQASEASRLAGLVGVYTATNTPPLPTRREEQITLTTATMSSTAAAADSSDRLGLEQAKRQVDISKLLSAIISVAQASEASRLAGLVGVYTATNTPHMPTRIQEQVTVTTVYTATVTTQPPSQNASISGYDTVDPSRPWTTGAAVTGDSPAVNYTSGMVITNPLRPGWASTVSDPSAAIYPHFNNTSVDTGSYLNISTFVAPQQPWQGQTEVATDTNAGQGTVTSTNVVQPTATQTDSSNTYMGFVAAATSDIGVQNSSALAMADIPGFGNALRAGAAIVGLCVCAALAL